MLPAKPPSTLAFGAAGTPAQAGGFLSGATVDRKPSRDLPFAAACAATPVDARGDRYGARRAHARSNGVTATARTNSAY